MNDLYIRDNPDRVGDPEDREDPDEYRKYVTCAYCGKLIKPYEDPRCYEFYIDQPLHKDCFVKMRARIRKKIEGDKKLEDLFDLMIDAFEDFNDTRTPDHSYDI